MTTGLSGESDAITSSGHCPHCGAELPAAELAPAELARAELAAEVAGDARPDAGEEVRFCPSCGRRVQGWRTGFRATVGGAAAGGVLPGGDEPTRAIAPSPSLLRAVTASKGGAPDPEPARASAPPTDTSRPMAAVRPSRAPLVLGLLIAGGAVAALLAMRARPAQDAPASVVEDRQPAPEAVAAKSIATPPAKKAGKPRRISAPPITGTAAATAPAAKSSAPNAQTRKASAQAGSGLPHKDNKKIDSKAIDGAGAASGTGPTAAPTGDALPMAANETVSSDATPMNEAERRAESAARVDADGVRFVVRAHLPQVQACYGRAFKESSPGGRVDVGFVIGAAGRATKIRTESNTTNASALARCLEQRIGEWEFPRPATGEFELIYPFVFSPGS